MIEITPKDNSTTRLRQLIRCSIPFARETDDAEAFLSTLSFQSELYPDRSVWIDTDFDGYGIDLEELSVEDEEEEWDDAVARVRVLSLEDALDVTQVWLSGQNLSDWYSNLNKQYGFVNKKMTSPAIFAGNHRNLYDGNVLGDTFAARLPSPPNPLSPGERGALSE